MDKPAASPAASRREALVATLLVACVAIVAFWLLMAQHSRRPQDPYELTAADFESFAPAPAAWIVQRLPVRSDPVEPNIIALLLRPRPGAADTFPDVSPVLVRLVHGYNLVDCMREKGEDVQLVADTREKLGRPMSQVASPTSSGPATWDLRPETLPAGLQLWRLVSTTSRRSVWASAMLRAGDFAPTASDTRDMPYPRVPFAGNPAYFPQGLSWKSLRHPIRNGRLFLQDKWNTSRGDLLTFLGLRQPAWASEELLTLVAASTDASVVPEREARTTAAVVAALGAMQAELQQWAARTYGDAAP